MSRQSERHNIFYASFGSFTTKPLTRGAYETMRRGCEQLKSQGVHHWISSGNLLGLYRDGKLIDYDTDIDVNVLSDFDDPVEFKLEGFSPLITVKWKHYPMQTAFLDSNNNTIFDIYHFYPEGDIAINYNSEGYIEKPLKFVTELDTLEHDGYEYPIPNHIEEFLEWRFGDWQVPTGRKRSWTADATHLTQWS